MTIKAIQIKNFWQQGNLHWELFPDVNVLVGSNGMGKTTILNMIEEALEPNDSDFDITKFRLIERFAVEGENGLILVESGGRRRMGTALTEWDVEKIATFDSGEEIDKLLAINIERFVKYQRNLLLEIQQVYERKGEKRDVTDAVRMILERKTLFVKFIDFLFAETGKWFDETDFAFRNNGHENLIQPQQLSSGEKQILLILLVTLLQEGRHVVLLLDEPEISLHIEWQKELIGMIRQLNPNCQVIAVTHSPTLYYSSWFDRKQNIEELFGESSLCGGDLIKRQEYPIEEILSRLKSHIDDTVDFSKGRSEARMFAINSILSTNIGMGKKECDAILDLLNDRKIEPNSNTYIKLIMGSESTEVARWVFDKIPKNDKERSMIVLSTFNALIRIEDDFETAMDWLSKLSAYSVRPEISTFQALLSKARNSNEAKLVEKNRSDFLVDSTPEYTQMLKLKS